jgi:hypothetical protein
VFSQRHEGRCHREYAVLRVAKSRGRPLDINFVVGLSGREVEWVVRQVLAAAVARRLAHPDVSIATLEPEAFDLGDVVCQRGLGMSYS